jgi:hypothetical protein
MPINGKCSLFVRQTPRHQGKRRMSLRFGLFVEFRTAMVFTLSFFWIFLQFLGVYRVFCGSDLAQYPPQFERKTIGISKRHRSNASKNKI